MKTIKTLFAVVVLSSVFYACEAETLNEEVGIEDVELLGTEDDSQEVQPGSN